MVESICSLRQRKAINANKQRGWDKSPSLSIVFGLSSKTQWLSGLYYADFISFYSPTQLCGGGTTKSNSNELPISVPLSCLVESVNRTSIELRNKEKQCHCLLDESGFLLQSPHANLLPILQKIS